MERQVIAYLLLLAIALALAAWRAHSWYFAREKVYRRRTARERIAHEKSMTEQTAPPAPPA